MGQVYLADQISLKRKVALKLMRAELMANPTALQRFKAEAEAVARVTHANIVQVYQIGEEAGLNYMVLEYVEGRNLREFVSRKGPPELLVAVSILRQAAAALQRASELGIIHRDIKPENILLTRKGEVKVADFGLSRVLGGNKPSMNLTESGIIMGTPLYMSPEQIKDKEIDGRSDIYSLGITAYFMMTGQPPFKGDTAFEIALKHVQQEAVPLATIRPDLPPVLCAIIARMMAKDPGQRYQTGRDLVRDLIRFRETLTDVTLAFHPGTVALDTNIRPRANSALQTGVAITPSNQAPLLPVEPSLPPPRLRWIVGSLGLALVAGFGMAWLTSPRTSRVTGPVTPADPQKAAQVSPRQRLEQALTLVAEPYLNPLHKTSGPDEQKGLGNCLDLGLFYLDNHRLDEAGSFFYRLEGNHQPKYSALGKLGRGIVYGLRSRSAESNQIFKKLFQLPKANQAHSHSEVELLVVQNPRLRYWFGEALSYNSKNGPEDVSWAPNWLVPLINVGKLG
jgi:serine/threonine-protein kinase